MKVDPKEYAENYLHCHFCGGFLARDEKGTIRCDSCLRTLHLNPIPTNAVIIQNEKAEILLVKRKYEPKKNYWDLPGGFVELNETVEDSLRREVSEELGIELQKVAYLASFYDGYEYEHVTYPVLGFVFTAACKGDTSDIKASDDISEVAFFPPDTIPFEELAFDNIKEALQLVLKN